MSEARINFNPLSFRFYVYLGVEVEDLFGSERALETAFAGSNCRQIFLQLVQRTQRRTARTETEEWAELSSNSCRGLMPCKQNVTRTRRELRNVCRARWNVSWSFVFLATLTLRLYFHYHQQYVLSARIMRRLQARVSQFTKHTQFVIRHSFWERERESAISLISIILSKYILSVTLLISWLISCNRNRKLQDHKVYVRKI